MMDEKDELPKLVLDVSLDQAVKKILRAGDLCPVCQKEKLDYDGMLNLSCSHCGFVLGGSCFS